MRVDRRMAWCALMAAGLLAASTSCGGDRAGAAVIASSVPHTRPTSAAGAAGAATVRHVGIELYAPIAAAAGTANVAYSPASITMALGMTRAGAQGTSARQLDTYLGPTDPSRLHAALNGVEATLRANARKTTDSQGQKAEIDVSLANSLWVQAGVEWQRRFLDTLKQSYDTGLHVVDYKSDHKEARRQVNGWVADQTRDHITDLIPEDTFDGGTRLALVNALHFAAPWNHRLDRVGTRPFTTAAGTRIKAPAMGRVDVLRFQEGNGWSAVTVPYAGGGLAMTFLLPDPGGLAAVEAALDDRFLLEVLGGGARTQVKFQLPRFDLAAAPDLAAALKAGGVTEPFVTTRDFRPMTTDPDAQPLQLHAAVHQATVAIDEKGTVASAATGVSFDKVGEPIPSHTFVVDRPFLFVIHDQKTHTPLFIGRVTDPTAH